MFDEKVILTRLQNGEDIQKIADEMVAMVNAVNKTYTEQKAIEEAAKKQVEIQKKERLQEILDMLADWLDNYYDIDATEELTADQVIELIDSLKEYVDALKDLESMFGKKKPATKVIKSNTKPKQNTDDVIDTFLKNMGW